MPVVEDLRFAPQAVEGVAGRSDAVEAFFLCVGTGPLDEANAVVPASVPGAGVDLDLAVRAKAVEIVIDEGWPGGTLV